MPVVLVALVRLVVPRRMFVLRHECIVVVLVVVVSVYGCGGPGAFEKCVGPRTRQSVFVVGSVVADVGVRWKHVGMLR